jgi:hydroxyethylthiazole kinase-like uncharacterized protein yjeF
MPVSAGFPADLLPGADMRFILNRKQIRAYDRLAIEQFKIPGLLLMENAGRGAAEIIRGLIATKKRANIIIVCGTGNNGGDGFVVARQLQNDAHLRCVLIGERSEIRGDARVNFEAAIACKIFVGSADDLAREIAAADVIVDALFGTGLSRPLDPAMTAIVNAVNDAGAIRVALDLPSGLDADTGMVLGSAVKADHTITFAHPKPGLFTPEGNIHSGKIHCVAIGVPDEQLLPLTGFTARLIAPEAVAKNFSVRDAKTYKHRAGDVLVIAGSPGKTGAAKLVAEAALRAGAGLATICTWREALPAFEKEVKEIMLLPLDSPQQALERRGAAVIGPGLGLDEKAAGMVHKVLAAAEIPLVIDADALTLLATDLSPLKNATAPKILTPHAGEAARLLGGTSAEIEADRFGAAQRLAAQTGAVVILKGAHSIIAAPDGEMFVSPMANPVLATAGSGDTLAGIIAAFATSMRPLDAAVAGVYVHACAADLWRKKTQSDRGMLASDIAALVPDILGLFDRAP